MSRIWVTLVSLLSLIAGQGYAQTAPDDPYFSSSGTWGQSADDQWALKSLRVYGDVAGTAPDTAPARVVVAVIDTGIDYRHPDLAAEKLWQNPKETRNGYDDDGNGYVDDLIGWNFVDDNNNPWDQSGHGTHIAGAIAACTGNGVGIAAVNPDARIMALKVANFVGQARSSAVAAAIRYAADQGARVINLSLGGELITDLEREAARYAAGRNVLIVVSAGNRGLNVAYDGYASLPSVLVVGASGPDGERAGFSNFGAPLAVLAPGVDVLSLRARDTDFIALSNPPDYPPGGAFVGDPADYYRASGTSFSAALVSGLASRILSLEPNRTALEVRHLLEQSAVDVGAPGVDQVSGYGRVDFVRALGTDPDQYVNARLLAVDLELVDEQIWLNVKGTANAGQFGHAELSVRAAPGAVPEPEDDDRKKKKKSRRDEESESPYDWQTLASIDQPVEAGALGREELQNLIRRTGGATSWELKLAVTDAAGATREARMAMALPVPDAPTGEVAGE